MTQRAKPSEEQKTEELDEADFEQVVGGAGPSFPLSEANNIFRRALGATSDIGAQNAQTAKGIIDKIAE